MEKGRIGPGELEKAAHGHTWKLNKKVMRNFVLTKAPKERRNSAAGAEQPDMGGEGT